tara:strand:+ start:1683 stop:2771 length:1089 start_codon:yes stop_codon:yes gene_type:complete
MNFFYKVIKTIITIIFYLFDSFIFLLSKIFFRQKIINKTLLVNLGALGDSILFLNIVIQLNEDHDICALIDSRSEILFDKDDKIDYYHINSKKYLTNIFYRTRTNLHFSRFKYDKVVNLRGSRNGIYEDSIIRFIGGKKYALLSDYNSNSKISLKIFDYFNYDYLIQFNPDQKIHELERFNILINKVFEKKISLRLINLSVYFKKILKEKLIIEKYFLLNVGAGKNFRKWNINKFIEIGNFLEKNLNLIPVYCGQKNDRQKIENSQQKMSVNSINLCGQTSVEELINLINFSYLNICNDSANAHISISLNKQTICIKSKFHQNRFIPYPKSLSIQSLKVLSSEDINDISVRDVIQLISFNRN